MVVTEEENSSQDVKWTDAVDVALDNKWIGVCEDPKVRKAYFKSYYFVFLTFMFIIIHLFLFIYFCLVYIR